MQSSQHLLTAAMAMLALVGLSAGRSDAVERWSDSAFNVSPDSAGAASKRLEIRWAGLPLRAAIDRLSDATSTSIFLDRRLDPGAPIDLAGQGTAAQLIELLAAKNEAWGASSIGAVLYLGPQQAARELQTLHARSQRCLAALPNSLNRRFRSRRLCEWPRLTEPRQIVADAVQAAGLQIESNASLPHDLWPVGTLPQSSLAEQLTLLLVGFDRQWAAAPEAAAPETGAVVIAPIERPVQMTAWHEAPHGSNANQSDVLRLAPAAKIEVRGRRWTLTGLVEEHTLLERYLRGKLTTGSRNEDPTVEPGPAIAAKRLSLELREQPVGAILRQLAKSLDLDFEIEDADPQAMRRRISIRVKEVTLSALLEEMGKKAGCEIRLQGRRIAVAKILKANQATPDANKPQ